MKATVIGLGLIGGSIAIDLRRRGFVSSLVGVESNAKHARQALEAGLVDDVAPLADALRGVELVILAIPVDAVRALAPAVLDAIGDAAVVLDTGSTKATVCAALAGHPRRAQFVAAHPIAGTENSGPLAALAGLFQGKVNIICERELSSPRALSVAESLFELLGMRTIFMDAAGHDLHLAYVSHLSHVSSFLLGQTVLDIEKSEESIFDLAGSGFASTVRLAKSSPSMWVPIFEQNAENLGRALDEYIAHLDTFRRALAARDSSALYAITNRANDIRRVLDALGARASAGAGLATPIPVPTTNNDRTETLGGTQ
ncbi:MAG: prephenate dehydrogenase [Acidobacteria bacterium]|nr:prephenate dehydrogenase [Acidobacteriota bacterium]